jgi:hypothetical protein
MRLMRLSESHRFIVDGAARTGNNQNAVLEQTQKKDIGVKQLQRGWSWIASYTINLAWVSSREHFDEQKDRGWET